MANEVQAIYGILNGTTNYILTEMTQRGMGFSEVLKKAQELGYAEADPTFDVEGIDAAHKLCILLSLAYGIQVKLEDVYTEGITGITPMDIEYAKELGYTVSSWLLPRRTADLSRRGSTRRLYPPSTSWPRWPARLMPSLSKAMPWGPRFSTGPGRA